MNVHKSLLLVWLLFLLILGATYRLYRSLSYSGEPRASAKKTVPDPEMVYDAGILPSADVDGGSPDSTSSKLLETPISSIERPIESGTSFSQRDQSEVYRQEQVTHLTSILTRFFEKKGLRDCITSDVVCEDASTCSFHLSPTCAEKSDGEGHLSYLLSTLSVIGKSGGTKPDDAGVWDISETLIDVNDLATLDTPNPIK